MAQPSDEYWTLAEPDRFTPWEVLAHLADFEAVFRRRLLQTLKEERPTLWWRDPGELAVEHRYDEQEPHDSLRKFAVERAETLVVLRSVPTDAWLRIGVHPRYGEFTLISQVIQVHAHDLYHLRQLADVLASLPTP